MWKVYIFVLTALLLILVLKQSRSEYAYLAALASASVLFLFVLREIAGLVEVLRKYFDRLNMDGVYPEALLKMAAVACISDFVAGLSRDAGQSALALQIELAGKVGMILLSLPCLIHFLEVIGVD